MVIQCDDGDDIFVGTAIIDLYAKCGDIDAVEKEFSCMPVCNAVSCCSEGGGY